MSLNPCIKQNGDKDLPNRSSVDISENCKMLDCEEEIIPQHHENQSKLPSWILEFCGKYFFQSFKIYCQVYRHMKTAKGDTFLKNIRQPSINTKIPLF